MNESVKVDFADGADGYKIFAQTAAVGGLTVEGIGDIRLGDQFDPHQQVS
jgi:hypothetical protein